MKLIFALLLVVNTDADPVRIPVVDCDTTLVAMGPNMSCDFRFSPDLKEDLVEHPEPKEEKIAS